MNGYYQRSFYNSNNRRNQNHHQYGQFYHQQPYPQGFGTLTPILRQRAFHDAIYEEEYGSEQEDECCQSRGMSAIFCWFLSVIILIGLAASVVLTVFFILKSKNYMTKNGELDLLFDREQGISFQFPETTTELNSLDFPSSASSSKEFSVPSSNSFEDDDEQTENNNNSGSTFSTKTSTSTRFPPSRKGPSEMFSEEKTADTSESPTKYRNPYDPVDFPQSVSKESINSRGRPTGGSEEIISDESSNRPHPQEPSSEDERSSVITTSTASTPSQHVLFTSPPDPTVTSATTYRRNLQTTRFPTGRTSFSTSTETLIDTPTHNNNDDNDNENDPDNDERGNQNDNDSQGTNGLHRLHHNSENNENEDDNDRATTQYDTGTSPSTLIESKEREVDVIYKNGEESQLNKMLLDEIPPHPETTHDQENEESEHEVSQETSHTPVLSSEFNLPTTISSPARDTITPVDPLARIIKNLAPKWGRNRTIETTTMTSGNYKYDYTISSREKERNRAKDSGENSSKEKYKSKESSTRTTMIITPETSIPSYRPSTEFQGINNGGKSRGSQDLPVNILNTIQSPNLSLRRQDHNNQENSEGENPFLDVLVGSEDHKSLITKQTEDGIVTSAILPPWYATSNSKNINTTQNVKNSTNSQSESDGQNGENDTKQPTTLFGGLMDFFKTRNNNNGNEEENNNPKRIVLKRPNGELLAQGSSHVSQSSENLNSNELNNNNNNNKEAPDFKDMVRNIAPGLRSTTSNPILESAVVTDDILPANNGFHYGTSDGGTNIYGYYPDEDQESDKTVEHQGIQSENLSDEIMEKVQPSHSIEVHVDSGGGSSEIVIEHSAENDPYSRYGEKHAGSETHGKFVDPPVTLGGGIRRPIKTDDEMDLEMKGSENRPVYATNPNNNISPVTPNNETYSKDNNKETYSLDDGNINTEVVDNSAERDPEVSHNNPTDLSEDFDQGSYAQEEEGDHHHNNGDRQEETHVQGTKEKEPPVRTYQQVPDSYETEIENSGSGEHRLPPVKWSKPDSSQITDSADETDNSPPTGSEELKVNPNSGDTNEVMERKPVIQLDEKLYPDSGADTSVGGSIGSTESKVHQIYPVGYSTTTQRPADEPTISEPETADEENSSKGFVAPTPVSFHDNKYTFSPPSSDTIYQSKDGWRPLVYNNQNSNDEESPEKVSTRPPHWRTRLPSLTTRPPTSPQTQRPTIPIGNGQLQEEEEEELEDEEEEGSEELVEDEAEPELTKYPWGQREQLLEKQPDTGIRNVQTKVKFPEHHNSHENSQSHQIQQPPQQTIIHHQQNQPNQLLHRQQQPPIQIHHPQPPQIQHQQIIQHQQQQQQPTHHHQPLQNQHQQRQPFQFPNNNHNIDRSKYMMRPAPPPIVMRRAPIQNMPYLPNRVGPQMIPHVQQPNQFNNNNAPPTEFPHPPPLMNRRFKNLGPRPRGNINWPTDESRKVDTAERRAG